MHKSELEIFLNSFFKNIALFSRAHVTLLDLMHSQQWAEDSIAEALLLAGIAHLQCAMCTASGIVHLQCVPAVV